MSTHPYAERFPVNRRLPESGRREDELLDELAQMATEEDAYWETGKCSGTMYCGDHEHYAFMGEAFQLFAHANILQRDMFPSATKLEGEIIAMTLDLMHGDQAAGDGAVGMVTTGGTGSIMHAVLAYREHGRQERGIEHPNIIKPETAHAAFDKAAHLFGLELRRAPVDPDTTKVRPEVVADLIDDSTVAVIGSACNYGYGTVDPIAELGALAQERGIGLHVDGCLGGFILPWGEELGYPVPPFDFRVPGVTSISADTHKYAYGLKGTSVLLFRDRALRNSQYFFLTDWTGGKYCSPGMEGSRSGGLLAATWAGMLKLGRGGYLRYAQQIFETSAAMQAAVNSHPELRMLGEDPTFLFSFTADEFDVYHVNDFMRGRGWRFNGQQYPNALHMAVTRPQTQAGVADTFATDLADAVTYAKEQGDEPPKSGAIYGGIPGGMTADADEFIRAVMTDMMDDQQALPDLMTGAALGIDVGSTNVKVARVDEAGGLQASTHRPLVTRRDGDVVEQDADALWAAVADAVAEVADPAVGAIGVCSQYSSIVPVDAAMVPVAPMAMYDDQRGTDHCWAIMGEHPEAFERFVEVHGIPPVGSGLSLGHLLHFQRDRPEVHAATAHYLEAMDLLVARLTGRAVGTQNTQFTAQLCDNRSVGVTAYDEELLGLAGVDRDRLPELVAVDAVVGPVTAAVAADLGLPDGVAVRVGMNDSAAGALAGGAFGTGRGGLAMGTTAVVLDTVADKRVDLDAELVSMPSAVAGRWLAWAENGIAGRAVEHGMALLDGSFAHLEVALDASPPGAGGVLFLPWLVGSMAPSADRRARGGFLNVSLDTTREDLVRAMVEGTALNLSCLLPEVERFTGQPIEELVFFGGAARSPGWAQTLADVLGRPVSTVADPEVAVAVAVARAAQGADPEAPPTVAAVHEPRPEAAEQYAAAREQFPAVHAALRPIHHALNP